MFGGLKYFAVLLDLRLIVKIGKKYIFLKHV